MKHMKGLKLNVFWRSYCCRFKLDFENIKHFVKVLLVELLVLDEEMGRNTVIYYIILLLAQTKIHRVKI